MLFWFKESAGHFEYREANIDDSSTCFRDRRLQTRSELNVYVYSVGIDIFCFTTF